jgi:hypothetical protein
MGSCLARPRDHGTPVFHATRTREPCFARRRDHGNPVFHASHAPGTTETLFPTEALFSMPRSPPGPRDPCFPCLRNQGTLFCTPPGPRKPWCPCLARPRDPCFQCLARPWDHRNSVFYASRTTETMFPMPRTPPGPRKPCFPYLARPGTAETMFSGRGVRWELWCARVCVCGSTKTNGGRWCAVGAVQRVCASVWLHRGGGWAGRARL